ncbi:hypothetical protein EVA25_02965 [bacterium]|nr:MAG: hypothetical protein EVA25_02965 [bacterium]
MANVRRKLLLGLSVSLFVTVALFTTLLAVDVYLHHRHEMNAGLNIWGYRGTVLDSKQDGEHRIAVVGGSTAFGYGVAWPEAIPALLQQKLNDVEPGGATYTAANLGYNNEGAYSYTYTLRDYAYLDYDLAILYTGYNDLGAPDRNTRVYRHESPVFTLTGYMPIFPLIFSEKAMVLRYGGDLEAAYRGKKTVFKPDSGDRFSAAALETAVSVSKSLERQLGRLTTTKPDDFSVQPTKCIEGWQFYCQRIKLAVDQLLAEGKLVIVVTQPYVSDGHVEQQSNMAAMLNRSYGDNGNVRYVNLGEAFSLDDREFAWDGVHLTAVGNDVVAAGLVEPVQSILR